ncbi:hypothetical protein MBLNU13_g11148t2 [Cladosporium sp. NU13]
MALAREIIDLVSDSEDESPSKRARLNLQAFVPRKEKAAPRAERTIAPPASTPQSTKNTPVAQKPLAPAPAPNTTNGWSKIPANASIAEILSRGLHSAARSVGILPPQLQQQPQHQPLVSPPSNVVNSLHRNGVPPGRPHTLRNSGSLQKQSKSSVQSKPSPTATQNRVPRTNGPLHEERQRRFIQYHQKEAERKSTKVSTQQVERVVDTKSGAGISLSDGLTATTQRGALPSVRPNGNPSTHSHQWSPSTDEPEAKRRKTEHEVVADKIATGMSEARRLSAAAITTKPASVTHDQDPDRTVSHFTMLGEVQSSSRLVEDIKDTPPVVSSQSGKIDLTDQSEAPTGPPFKISDELLNEPLTKVALSKVTTLPDNVANAHGSDSPDVKSADRMSICVDDSQPSIVANYAPSKPDVGGSDSNLYTAGISNGVANADESDSPDEIPAKPMRKRSPSAHQDAHPQPARSVRVPSLEREASPVPRKGPALDVDPQIDIETRNDPMIIPKTIAFPGKGKGNHGVPYSAEEDSLLAHLREDLGIGWEAMPKYFCGRTRGSLQVRYSSKLKNRHLVEAKHKSSGMQNPALPRTEAIARPEYTAPSRRHAKAAQRNDGFVSWADVKAQRREDRATIKSATPPLQQNAPMQTPSPGMDFAHPASLPRILRSRELGNTGRRNWSSTARLSVSDELQNHFLDTIGPRRYFHGASRDVTCVAWAADGNKFAAGAIAIDDERSMQYNRPNNLLLGDLKRNSLQELPEHHVARPIVSDSRNVNSLQAMQETQDARLFKTVAAVGFSEDSRALYSAGADGVVRMYVASSGQCISSLKQEAELALLASNSRGLLATGSHRSDDSSISVIRPHSDELECLHQFGPTRADVESPLPIFLTALKWGAGVHSHLLLAGFASDSYEDDRLAAGEVFLWDSTADQKIELPAARNVFDVAWNPIPSSNASLFAVASARTGKPWRSTIQCFAPDQGRASRVLQWDCPAFDINDLVYCPHDDNLIAAGATDGKVYIWDKRVAGSRQKPLHTFSHGKTKNVLDHDRDAEIADTGVRFLSWSATGNRLYSGSSDGTVKVWDPYRTTEDALVRDVATFNSAVMSGAFSPDFRDLLIGEDQGQLNLLGIDREARSVRAAKKFDYYPAPIPTLNEDRFAPARELLATEQVELRPMGALPVRQAVQGPNYQGPYLAPSNHQMSHLDAELQLALREQKVAHASLLDRMQDPETEKAFQAVDTKVTLSEKALQRAWQKREEDQLLQPAASLLQRKLHDSRLAYEKDIGKSVSKRCGLDCNYLPTAGDEDGEAPDNRQSEQRIPESLRTHIKALDSSDLTNAEIAEARLTSKCSAFRSGLTARCEKCATPVRPNLDESVWQNICERCNFHCFRCGGIATITGDTITCQSCDVQWEAGVLGYEVKKKSQISPTQVKDQSRVGDRNHEQMMESLDERMGRLLGEDERERLAGGWKVALVDGAVDTP